MKFRVNRISKRWSSDPPCENAVADGQRPIAKDQFQTTYSITINTLDELMEFIQRNGEIILNDEELRIYDDYAE